MFWESTMLWWKQYGYIFWQKPSLNTPSSVLWAVILHKNDSGICFSANGFIVPANISLYKYWSIRWVIRRILRTPLCFKVFKLYWVLCLAEIVFHLIQTSQTWIHLPTVFVSKNLRIFRYAPLQIEYDALSFLTRAVVFCFFCLQWILIVILKKMTSDGSCWYFIAKNIELKRMLYLILYYFGLNYVANSLYSYIRNKVVYKRFHLKLCISQWQKLQFNLTAIILKQKSLKFTFTIMGTFI